jgi:DNA mismatch repair ATPase MutS
LLAPKARLRDFATASQLLAVEPYDDALFCVRPLKCAASLTIAEKRLELAQRERLCEKDVLESLSQDVCNEAPNLEKYLNAALAFDLAWVRARMAVEHGLARPILHAKNSLRIEKGRFPPCEAACIERGLKYFPLDASFDSAATVIFGSNMGGKTVVLQTAALLQLAAQAGLFVPAARFETRVFGKFHYIGERRGGLAHEGLSGFGLEMLQLMQAWQSVADDGNEYDKGTMILMDEFARTTSSKESEALLAAVLEAISERANAMALCSTHFHRVPRVPRATFLRMVGFDRKNAAIGSMGPSKDYTPLDGSIADIAKCMVYALVQDDGKHSSDAIAIAQLLGLDAELVQRAKSFYDSSH